MLDAREQLAVVHGLQHGCRDAWTKLYDSYSVEVWRYAARLLGNDASAVADVVQETFLAAARSAKQFDAARGTLKSWLFGIAHHGANAYWRQTARLARLRRMADSGAAEIQHLLDSAEPVSQIANQNDIADLVRGALAELSADYAALLTAKYLDDRSLSDLASEHSGSVDSIKSKLSRARREFREQFERLVRRENAADAVEQATAAQHL